MRRFSLVSRSRTCLSFRSRKALCLWREYVSTGHSADWRHHMLTLLCFVLSVSIGPGSEAPCPHYLISCLVQRGLRCPDRERYHYPWNHYQAVRCVVMVEMLSWGYVPHQIDARFLQQFRQNCSRKRLGGSCWRRRTSPCSRMVPTSAAELGWA